MSMFSKLFRPSPTGAGNQRNLPARFVAAFVNGTDLYRGDLVHWDHTAPTDQGTSSVVDGKAIAAGDYMFVRHAAATTECGLQAGILTGTTIHQTDGATALTNDRIGIVQTWGVHQNVWVDSTDTAAASKLTCAATTGECTYIAAWAATATDAADGALVAVALTADSATHVRGTSTTEEGCVAFIRCDM